IGSATPQSYTLSLHDALPISGSRPEDRVELARFLPRALRRAFAEANWRDTHRLLELLEHCNSSEWSAETFSQELMQPISVSSIRSEEHTSELQSRVDLVCRLL